MGVAAPQAPVGGWVPRSTTPSKVWSGVLICWATAVLKKVSQENQSPDNFWLIIQVPNKYYKLVDIDPIRGQIINNYIYTIHLLRPQEMWLLCLSVCLSDVCPQLVIFHFPDFIPEKGNTNAFLAEDYDFRVLLML